MTKTTHMKKEFGKWLMDIAKYMTTALLLSSVFINLANSAAKMLIVNATTLATLVLGLLLTKEK